jgi:indolepyruvate ferredoxin oxidoreductase
VEHREVALELARLPEQIRGFGPVKAASVERAEARRAQLLEALSSETATRAAAE